jgi:acetoin utilization protein AcuB
MKQIPSIKSVMTTFPHSIDSSESIRHAAEMMSGHAIQHLPVTEGGRLVGVLTDRDLARALCEDEASGAHPSRRVGQIGVTETYIVELTEPLDVVLSQMAQRNVDSALVVKEERLVGIFTRTDACRSFAELLRSLFPRNHDDDAA